MKKRDKHDVLMDLLEYVDNKSLWVDYYHGCAELGYDDKPVLAADWNPVYMARIYDWAETYFEGEISLEWSDEWTWCSDCNKAVKTSPTSYNWQQSFLWASDCEIVCQECWEDSVEDIIDTYINQTDKAVVSDFYPFLEKAGFVCYSPEEYCQRFETGWHSGQDDDPQEVAKDIEKNLPDHDYIFKIDAIGQFDCHWSVFLRKSEEECIEEKINRLDIKVKNVKNLMTSLLIHYDNIL